MNAWLNWKRRFCHSLRSGLRLGGRKIVVKSPVSVLETGLLSLCSGVIGFLLGAEHPRLLFEFGRDAHEHVMAQRVWLFNIG